jgi:hypothetical protein
MVHWGFPEIGRVEHGLCKALGHIHRNSMHIMTAIVRLPWFAAGYSQAFPFRPISH